MTPEVTELLLARIPCIRLGVPMSAYEALLDRWDVQWHRRLSYLFLRFSGGAGWFG
jgi:hypothetical protein